VPSGAATTCLAGNKLVNFLSQFCVCVCGWVGGWGGEIPYPFFPSWFPLPYLKRTLQVIPGFYWYI
jgi:hypothetical protein